MVAALTILGGLPLVLFAVGLTLLSTDTVLVAVQTGDFAVLSGAIIVALLAITAVTVAGASLLKGLLFHVLGIVGAYIVGDAFAPSEPLKVAGGVLYAAV